MSVLSRRLAGLLRLVLAGSVVVSLSTLPAPSASAAPTLLCSGYTGCAHAGLSSAGYASARRSTYWRMYAGHNCTNYVAYRMTRSGMPNVRPWSGRGNATYWGVARRDLTNAVPRVGAVAWWRAYARPAGAAGHVAYVERVVSASEIIVSQDSWGGDFSWRRITRGSGSWPSGFLHFRDVPMTSTVRPTVSGTPRVDATLTTTVGAWYPGPDRTAVQWLADGVPVRGATGRTLQLARAQQGRRISVRVTASRLGYPPGTSTSAATPAVTPGVLTSTVRPAVVGDPVVDVPLSVDPGQWSPSAVTLAYQWLADGRPLAGATGAHLVPGAAQVGAVLTVRVTATRPGYGPLSVTSAPTAPVRAGVLTLTAPVAVTGVPRPGERLLADPGAVATTGVRVRVTWLRAGVPVRGAVGPSYRLGTEDLGAHIRALSTYTKPGYSTLVTGSRATYKVRADPQVALVATSGRGRLDVSVRVTADLVPRVSGRVTLTVAGRASRRLVLHGGLARTVLVGLAPGPRRMVLTYDGSSTVSRTLLTRSLQVR